ncbi:MAG: hypothetical protein ACTH4Y_08320 [Microbacterium gubbeenense]|uniref:hypothetical protein n=1 Tax=Microbacterium gubbeenense TaxID=159896 RepID=UPI003F99463F
MTRNRASAKSAGTWMETQTANFLAASLGDDRIERRTKNGSKDRGDIGGVRTRDGVRVVVEVKNTSKLDLGGWMNEVNQECQNDGALIGVVVHKRRGKGEKQMGEQYVTMTLDDLALLLGGRRL